MSLRCTACRQLKSAEDELAKAQSTMRDQSLEISKGRRHITDMYNKLQAEKRSLQDALVEIGRLTSELSAKSQELRDAKGE